MSRAHIPVLMPRAYWQLVIRTMRGGPKRNDVEQLDTIIKHIETSIKQEPK